MKNKLKKITIDRKGNVKLRGKILENIFPIGRAYYFSDQWGCTWKEEMEEKIPKNAKYYTCKLEFKDKLIGYEDFTYTVAHVQFYGQKKNDSQN